MDPYSAEGGELSDKLPPIQPQVSNLIKYKPELVNIHTAFHQAQYQQVIDFDTSSFSPDNALPARILQLRAQLALHQYSLVLSSITPQSAKTSPDLSAVRIYASHFSGSSTALSEAETLAETHSSNLTVQLLIGTLFAATGSPEKALALLSLHDGSLDAVALTIQLHLSQNRLDLAKAAARAARTFAQDALLVNLAEAWCGLREGGEQSYQQAFYVFEELAQSPSQTSVTSLVQQAVSEVLLGRYPEAETALQMALERDAGAQDALSNAAVLYAILGDEGKSEEVRGKLDAEGEFLKGLSERKSAFDAACAKYSPKFEP